MYLFNLKQNLIETLLNRSHYICDTYVNKHKEIQNIFDSLLCNGYPKSFINKNIKQFLMKIRSQFHSKIIRISSIIKNCLH